MIDRKRLQPDLVARRLNTVAHDHAFGLRAPFRRQEIGGRQRHAFAGGCAGFRLGEQVVGARGHPIEKERTVLVTLCREQRGMALKETDRHFHISGGLAVGADHPPAQRGVRAHLDTRAPARPRR